MDFYKCTKCGNLLTYFKKGGCTANCCGQEMVLLKPNTTDASNEKHVPVVTQNGNKVSVVVGSVEHPMLEEHSIQWIIVETDKGYQVKYLNPGEKPVADFVLAEGENYKAAYEFCNLHGVWKAE